LNFLDNQVDPQSGTIRLKARFPNTDHRLWPGQFVNVTVRLASPEETVVPVAAVRAAQTGSYVFVVKADNTAEQRTVETPRNWNDLAIVRRGVKPGEKVIVEGQVRVKAGSTVQIVPPRGAPAQQSSPVATGQ